MQKSLKKIRAEHIFFALSVLFSIIITYFITNRCIDADASSELVLAEHLAKTGQLLSTDWFYSTELRVLNTQLIYAPLFLLFNSWHLVRFFGSVILQGILVGSFYLFTRFLKLNPKVFYLSAGLFLLPLSVCWGRIVLYNCYYVPHIAISLIIVGLTFSDRYHVWRLSALGALSLVGGLGGIRQLMMTHAPILLALALYWLMADLAGKNETPFLKRKWRLLLTALLSAGLSAVGFLINKFYLIKLFSFVDYSENTINLLDAAQLKEVFYGFFHHFGFRNEIGILSVMGILSVLGILLGIYCLIAAIGRIKKCKGEEDLSKTLPQMMFLSFAAVMLLVFLLIGNGYYFVLYLTPLVIWAVPVFIAELCDSPKAVSLFHLQRLLPLTAAAILLVNGLANSLYFLSDHLFAQKYEGLSFQTKNQKALMTPAVEFLEQEGYELGYATFWNSNILTEMTDGGIKTVTLTIDHESGNVVLCEWLTLRSNRDLKDQKDFLLLEASLQEVFEANNDLSDCTLVYRDDGFIIYDIAR